MTDSTLVMNALLRIECHDWAYLTEGNANLIFVYTGGSNSNFDGKILRFRKNGTAVGVKDAHSYIAREIVPLLGAAHVVVGELIPIDRNVIVELNDMLKVVKRTRKDDRGISQEDGLALLMEDLRDEDVVQFKPKWLCQSPTAPDDWVACRTCALHRSKGKTEKVGHFCPLDLGSGETERVMRAAKAILEGSGLSQESLTSQFVRILTASPVLVNLREAQARYDRTGPFRQEGAGIAVEGDEDLPLAMTLRDCTLFVDIRRGRVRIIDLDPKDEVTKGKYWMTVERSLTDGGWYMGRGMLDGEQRCYQ
ncbi:Inositol-pentakisphosphate 2-kinase [Saitoella coloradoensis]